MKKILICDASYKTESIYDQIYIWDSYSCNHFSLPEIVEKKSDYLKSLYLDWVYVFGNLILENKTIKQHLRIRPKFSMWSMSLIVEKSSWKSPEIYSVFKLLAFEDSLDIESIGQINVAISNTNATMDIKDWCEHRSLSFKNCYKTTIGINTGSASRLSFLLHTIHAFYIFAKSAFITLKNYRITSKKEGNTMNAVSFFSYLFNLNEEKLSQGVFDSSYWGKLQDLLKEDKIRVNWHHIFIKNSNTPSLGKAIGLMNLFEKNSYMNDKHIIIQSLLSFKLLKKSFSDYIKISNAGLNLPPSKIKDKFRIRNGSIGFFHLLKNDWIGSISGASAVSNAIYLNLFESTISKLPEQTKGYYLMENQAWERALIYCWNNSQSSNLIGVQHSAISYWDLRYFSSKKYLRSLDLIEVPFPDYVALIGNASRKLYVDSGWSVDRIFKVEALRYLYLSGIQKPVFSNNTHNYRLLVAGDYKLENTNNLMRCLSSLPVEILKKYEIIVKPHPACPIDKKQWKKINFNIVNLPFSELIDDYDIALTSDSTSAAVDVYLSQKPVLILSSGSSFNLTPLRGCSGAKIIHSISELGSVLCQDVLTIELKTDNSFFYLNNKLLFWQELLHK